jgi:methanogenic corrinoid protein MtbC1
MPVSGQLVVARGFMGDRSSLPALAECPPPPWPGQHANDQMSDRAAATLANEHRAALAYFVESQVLPRLKVPAPARAISMQASVSALAELVPAFVPLLLHRNITDASAFLMASIDRGHSVQAIYLGLLTPAAQHYGKLWQEDAASFADVSIAVGRLNQLLLLPAGAPVAPARGALGRDIMLLAQPGAQHSLGLSMVRAFFQHAGWRVGLATPDSVRDLTAIMRENWFGVVGFSVTGEDRLEAIRAGIDIVRRASRNRRIGIMVGGPAFIEHPEYAANLGADCLALDGEAAVKQAENLLVVPARHV